MPAAYILRCTSRKDTKTIQSSAGHMASWGSCGKRREEGEEDEGEDKEEEADTGFCPSASGSS